MNNDLQVDRVGDYLSGRSIALCVTGGIAAIEAPKVARQLRRYGAKVRAYTTPSAKQFIGTSALEWGTGQPVVEQLSGLAEHICTEDAVLVCPATLDTINKIVSGIADNPVTTLAASALGMKKKLFIAPTMHESLANNPILQKNLALAKEYGITVIPPRVSERKWKLPTIDAIAADVSRALSTYEIRGRRVLVTGGPTPVKIDRVRQITNVFKGTLAREIAKEAHMRGADVTLLLGDTGIPVPSYLHTIRHKTLDEYVTNVFSELEKGYDAGIFSAAVADYQPDTVVDGKIPSGGPFDTLHLVPTKKVIKEVRAKYPSLFMATFKYECDKTENELLDIANARIDIGYDLVVANRDVDMLKGHKAIIVTAEGIIAQPTTKANIARELIYVIGRGLGEDYIAERRRRRHWSPNFIP